MTELSVVIPTYNRKQLLNKVLNSLSNQSYDKKKYEIIIVDDGSNDGTEQLVKNSIKKSKINIRYFKQKNNGPASARNIGIKKSNSKLILFLDDDVVPSNSLLAEHVKMHKNKDDIAVIGYMTWANDMKVNNFMKTDPIFHYNKLKDKGYCGFGNFFTCNLSIKKSWFKDDLFDEKFSPSMIGKEDVELGYRLVKKGLKIIFDKYAIAYHYHYLDEKDFMKRTEKMGELDVLFHNKYPELGNKLRLLITTKLMLVFLSPIKLYNIFLLNLNRKLYWRLNLLKSRYTGLNKGFKKYGYFTNPKFQSTALKNK